MLASNRNNAYFSILDRCPAHIMHDLAGERLREVEDASRIFDCPFTAKDQVEQCLEADFQLYLENDILPKVDRTSMAASLEVRNPFLDHELVEFAASLPIAFKLHALGGKHILKEACKELLPPDVASAQKRGFGLPVGQWLRTSWKQNAHELLFANALYRDGWLSRPAVAHLWKAHQDNSRDFTYLLFNLLVLSIFLDSASVPRP